MADSSGEGPVKELVDGISGINVDGKAEPKSPVMEDVLKTPTTPATPGSPISVNGTPSSPGTPTKDGKTLLGQFKAFSKFGDPKSDGKSITLSQSDKWMKQAGLIDGKKITTTDTGIYFKKFKSLKIGFADWQKFLAELTKTKQFDLAEAKEKLISCGPPGTRVKVSHSTGVYDRLTNTNNFTGTHKERFDGSGRGKGLEGRREKSDSGGYVQGYKNRNSYDQSH